MTSFGRDRGFTLIELLVVIAIIAILVVALGGYWLSNRPHYRLMSAARDLASDMRTAKQLAASRSASPGTLTSRPVPLRARIDFSPAAVDEPPGCAGPTYIAQVELCEACDPPVVPTVWRTVGDPALGLPSICRRFGAVEAYNGVALAPVATDPVVFQTNGTVTDAAGNLVTVTATLTQTQGANCPPCETSTVTLSAGGSVTITP